MTKSMLDKFKSMYPGEQYAILKEIAQNLHRAHNKYMKSCDNLKNYNGPYNNNAKGSTLYAAVEKDAKLVRDLRDQLTELVGVL